MNALILATLVVVVIAAGGVDALDCYDCSGNFISKNNCFDPFTKDAVKVTTCAEGQSCYKTKSGVGDAMLVRRGCGDRKTDGCDPANAGDGPASCYCSSNKCNGAGKQAALATGTLLAAALLFMGV
ncbi:hypothetical protein BV898_09735 [Hypsibius exemplaris]|uniref:UPAR/Ly6 domain-containing protein n=1 Tax=Hypsibius exemplaris TaxID=2072580 RepID=A0A1W0WLN0_HYPEX|nr:hypothetical protein BV898_09735 [Hypsibius exemplaris]